MLSICVWHTCQSAQTAWHHRNCLLRCLLINTLSLLHQLGGHRRLYHSSPLVNLARSTCRVLRITNSSARFLGGWLAEGPAAASSAVRVSTSATCGSRMLHALKLLRWHRCRTIRPRTSGMNGLGRGRNSRAKARLIRSLDRCSICGKLLSPERYML